jgi:hypothetical protein
MTDNEAGITAPAKEVLTIFNTSIKRPGFGVTSVLGEVTNNSASIQSANLRATFYAADGSIVGTAYGSVIGVQPGQTKTFELVSMDDLKGAEKYKVGIDVLVGGELF